MSWTGEKGGKRRAKGREAQLFSLGNFHRSERTLLSLLSSLLSLLSSLFSLLSSLSLFSLSLLN